MKKFETVQSAYDGGYPDANGNVFSHGESVYIVLKADLDRLEAEAKENAGLVRLLRRQRDTAERLLQKFAKELP